MIAGNVYSSLDEEPKLSMFTRAGGEGGKKRSDSNSLTEAFTQAAVAVSSALSQCSNSPATYNPAKLIEARSKSYKQLHDFNSLKGAGVLTEDEYTDEKEAVLEVLKKLK